MSPYKDIEKHREYNRKYEQRKRKMFPEKDKAYKASFEFRESRRRCMRRLKQETMNAYGGHCACCGESILEFLSLDHINNDGAMQRRQHTGKSGGGLSFYKLLKRNGFPQGQLQVLCHNCNCAKGYYGYCPHEKIAKEALGIKFEPQELKRPAVSKQPKIAPIVVKKSFKGKLPPEVKKQVVDLYETGTLSMTAVGKQFGISTTAVHYLVHKRHDVLIDRAELQ